MAQYVSVPGLEGKTMKTAAVSEIISHLKAIKEDENLSCQEIFEMVEANGDSVSLATIKRIFAAGSENQRFRYEDTVAPVARVLFGTRKPAEELSTDQVQGLQEVITVKQLIAEETAQQIAEKEHRIEDLTSERDAYRSKAVLYRRVAFCLAAAVILLFIIDIAVPGAGWLSLDIK